MDKLQLKTQLIDRWRKDALERDASREYEERTEGSADQRSV
jgi:hypothetical protein